MNGCKSMSMCPKVSVIVAVYKAEKYLYRCLNSLVEQTFDDYEVVLVDDGSPDNSGVICDRFAVQHPFVRVIHKTNGGVASARQCGIDCAQGEYTIHVDADDWVEPNMLEELYRKAKQENADMVICDFFEIVRKERYIKQTPTALSTDAVLRDLLNGHLHGSSCNKLIRRSCYENYHICFPQGLILEDLFVNCNLCMNNIRIAYLNKAFYHYDRSANRGSLTLTPNRINIQSRMAFISFIEEKIDVKAYQKELDIRKCLTKKEAWASQLYSKEEFLNLYKEVNCMYTDYVECKSPTSRCVLLCLSGHYRLAKIGYGLWRLIRKFLY